MSANDNRLSSSQLSGSGVNPAYRDPGPHKFTELAPGLYKEYHELQPDRRHCFSVALEQAMIAEYKSYWKKKLRLDRQLLGKEFEREEVFIDLKYEESRLHNWLVTISFPHADGDPYWSPDDESPTVFQRMKQVERWYKCLSCLKYCYEWTKTGVLHVHLSFRWVGNGGQQTILKRFQQAFIRYIPNLTAVDVKKCNKNMIWYLKKEGDKYEAKRNVYIENRKSYGIEDLYPLEKKAKPS